MALRPAARPPPAVRVGIDPSPCTVACVYLDHAGGPGLENVTICQGFAAEGGSPVGTTDATGAYQAKVRDTQGHQETVIVRAVAPGYHFDPPYQADLTQPGGETITANFIATASSDHASDGKCGSPPITR